MTDDTSRRIAAGWYEDPDDRALVRWWNGLAWTEHSAPRPTDDARLQNAEAAG